MDEITSVDAHWLWLALGLFLAALEMVVPGVYLIWLAVAAIITGVLAFVFIGSLPVQVVIFVALSLIAAYSAKRFLRDRPIVGADPLMNKRGGRLVGEVGVVTDALAGAPGRLHLGDSDWIARGPDMAVGTRVRVTGMDGTTLLVEPLESPADDNAIEGPVAAESSE